MSHILKLPGFMLACALGAAAAPTITGIFNAASWVPSGLANGSIAQGSIASTLDSSRQRSPARGAPSTGTIRTHFCPGFVCAVIAPPTLNSELSHCSNPVGTRSADCSSGESSGCSSPEGLIRKASDFPSSAR